MFKTETKINGYTIVFTGIEPKFHVFLPGDEVGTGNCIAVFNTLDAALKFVRGED